MRRKVLTIAMSGGGGEGRGEARLRILGGGQVGYTTVSVSVGAVCGYLYSSCLSRNFLSLPSPGPWGSRVVRWYWVNFQCRGILLIWVILGQGPIALPGGVGGGCLDIFISSVMSLFFLLPSGRRPNIDRNTVSKGR